MKLDIRRIFKNSVRLYFAPITGAFKAVRSESRRISREQHRQTVKPH
jgi:hypothetical protein